MRANSPQGLQKEIAVTDASNEVELPWFVKMIHISDFKAMIERP